MEVKFKIATSSDVESIVNLCNFVFEEKTSLEYAKKIFEETKDNPNDIYLIGQMQDQVVAHAKITIIKTMYEDMNTYAILNHVCVHPQFRRHNIATKMLDEVTKICKKNNCKTIELWSMNFRKAAHACYQHYGFIKKNAGFFSKTI